MGFDAAGNFSRAYNYTQDRDNGIKILASHVDGEFDNFATAMNLVFFRDGRVPMSADLRLNINGIQGLKDGALGSPAIKFNTDANTGPYLDGLSRYAIGVNAVQRGVFTTTGFDVTGVLTASSSIWEAGSPLASRYATIASPTFTGVPAAPTAAGGTNTTQIATTAFVQGVATAYMPKSGGTFTGNVLAPVFAATGAGGAFYWQPRNGDVSTQPFAYSATPNNVNFNLVGVDRFSITNTGASVTGDLSTTGNGAFSGNVTANGGAVAIVSSSLPCLNLQKTGSFAGTAQLLNDGGAQFIAGAAGQTMHLRADTIKLRNLSTSVDFAILDSTNALFGTPLQTTSNLTVGGLVHCDDITTVRTSAPGTGAIYFGNSGVRYLYYDGTQFQFATSLNVGGNITSTSDARLKTNVRDFENGLAIVKALRPRRFEMYGKRDIGVVAQELLPIMPEVVTTDARGIMSVDYSRLVTPLIAAVQSLSDRLDRAGL